MPFHKNQKHKMDTKKKMQGGTGVSNVRWCLPKAPPGAARGAIVEEEGVAKPGEGPRVDVVGNQRTSRTRVSFSWMDGENGAPCSDLGRLRPQVQVREGDSRGQRGEPVKGVYIYICAHFKAFQR